MLPLKQWKVLRTLGQLAWPGLPGGGQLAAGFSPSPTALGVEAGVEERGERGEREQREEGGCGGHLEGAVECNSGRAPAGGEAEGSLTAHGPDRDELGQ